MTVLVDQTLRIEVIQDAEGFRALEEEWAELYEACPTATPFQSWAWLYSWWEHYGEGYKLRLIVVREKEGMLVGLIPLMLERHWGFGRLLFVGTDITDYLDILVREGREEEVAEAGARALGTLGGWAVADLQELRPEAAAWSLYRLWSGLRSRVAQSSCPLVEVKPWDDMVSSRSKRLRNNIRRTIKKAEKDGACYKQVGEGELDEAARRLVALHREQWRDRGISPEHLTDRFESHVVAAVRRMITCDLGGVSELWRDDEVLASSFLVFARDFIGGYLDGARDDARSYQISSLRMQNEINLASSRGVRWLDLLRGEEEYKERWSTRTVVNSRAILGHWISLWTLYAGYHALRFKAKQYVMSEEVPRWIKSAARKLKEI